MNLFEIADLVKTRQESGERYLEFFRSATLSTGIYELAAGSVDPQRPHTEDEVYYILSGHGAIQVGDASRPVQEGAVVFVEADVVHRFHAHHRRPVYTGCIRSAARLSGVISSLVRRDRRATINPMTSKRATAVARHHLGGPHV